MIDAREDSQLKKVPGDIVLKIQTPVILNRGKNSFLATRISIFAFSSFFSHSITSGREKITSDSIQSGGVYFFEKLSNFPRFIFSTH